MAISKRSKIAVAVSVAVLCLAALLTAAMMLWPMATIALLPPSVAQKFFEIEAEKWSYTARYSEHFVLSGRGDKDDGAVYRTIRVVQGSDPRAGQLNVTINGHRFTVGSDINMNEMASTYSTSADPVKGRPGWKILHLSAPHRRITLVSDARDQIHKMSVSYYENELQGATTKSIELVFRNQVLPLPLSGEEMRKRIGGDVDVASQFSPGP
jgi:hypothetical protein